MASERESDQCEISVVIPTRNRRRLLTHALASVLDQRDVEFEVIVIDEGSTDDTTVMVAAMADPRVRLIRHERPHGKSTARNRGIAEARGEWVAFLDDDDLWAPDKLRRQLDALRATGRVWAYTGAVNITEDHRVLGGAPPRPPEEVAASLPRVNGVPGGCSSVVVHSRALRLERFDHAYRLCEDWDLWIRLARTGPPAAVSKPLVGYRVHPGNSSIDTATYLAEVEIIDARYGGPVDRVTFYRHLARVCLRMNRQWPAFTFYLKAARHGRGYAAGAFIPDVVGVLRTVVHRVGARLGRPPHTSRQPRAGDDPNRAWRDEAREWLDEFVRRHVA
jgi:glycosyltransferase involved in cell wall biosynthesis